MNPRTYDCRLICDNCGRESMHDIPVRLKIVEYQKVIGGDDTLSHLEHTSGKFIDYVFCPTCLLPNLAVLYYTDNPPLLHEKVVINTNEKSN